MPRRRRLGNREKGLLAAIWLAAATSLFLVGPIVAVLLAAVGFVLLGVLLRRSPGGAGRA